MKDEEEQVHLRQTTKEVLKSWKEVMDLTDFGQFFQFEGAISFCLFGFFLLVWSFAANHLLLNSSEQIMFSLFQGTFP